MLWLPFLHGKISHQLNNVITQPISTFRITHHPISQEHLINHTGPPLNQPQRPPIAHPIPNATLNTNQSTNQGRNFPKKKLVEFTPIPVSYADLLPYLLDNVMVAITPTKVHQPPFFRGYDLNATWAYHGGVPRHSIEHCMTLKHKVQSLIDVGWNLRRIACWILTLTSDTTHGEILKALVRCL